MQISDVDAAQQSDQRVPCMHLDDAAQIPPPAHIDHLRANRDLLPASTIDSGPLPTQGLELKESFPEAPAVQFDFEYCVGCYAEPEDIDDHEEPNDIGVEGWEDVYEFDNADELGSGRSMQGEQADPDGAESDIADTSSATNPV
jgi:hypothetical protein